MRSGSRFPVGTMRSLVALVALLAGGAFTPGVVTPTPVAGAVVRGAVTMYGAEGGLVPAAGVTVSLENPAELGRAIASTVADASGAFTMEGLRGGQYVLSAVDLREEATNSGVTRQYYQSYGLPELTITVADGSVQEIRVWVVHRGATLNARTPSVCDVAGAKTTATLLSSPQFPPFGFSPTAPVTSPSVAPGTVTFTGLHANGESYAVRVMTTGDRGQCARVIGPFRPAAGQITDAGTLPLRSVAGGIDFDGDALSDVIVRSPVGELLNYRGNGGGGWLPTERIGDGWWQGMNLITKATGFGAVGEPDLIGRDDAGNLILWRGYGMPQTTWARTNEVIGTGWSIMTAVWSPGDFDGDAHADLLARDAGGILWLYPGDGSGGFHERMMVGSGWNVFSVLLAPGDFNGDGHPDVIGRQLNGVLAAYYGDGTGGWLTSRAVHVGSGWNIFDVVIGVGDFDGDANGDVLGRHARTGELVLYRSDGRGGWLAGGFGTVVGTGWAGMTFVS